MAYFTWTPAGGGSPITFGDAAPYLLTNMEGTGDTLTQASSQKSFAQIGTTAKGVNVDARTVALSLVVSGNTPAELYQRKQDLAAALTVEPTLPGELPELGTLVYHRAGMPAVEVKAIPQESPQYTEEGTQTTVSADVEFYCPYPYWKTQTDTRTAINTTEKNFLVNNLGSATAPVVLEIQGPAQDLTVTNKTTGKSIMIKGGIATGEKVTISTEFGKKAVTLTQNGVTSSILGRVPLLTSDFWQLKRGENVIRVSNSDGVFTVNVTVIHQTRYSGV